MRRLIFQVDHQLVAFTLTLALILALPLTIQSLVQNLGKNDFLRSISSITFTIPQIRSIDYH
jgi:hypothetical protein